MATAKAGSPLAEKAAARMRGASVDESERYAMGSEGLRTGRQVDEDEDDYGAVVNYTSPQATSDRFRRVRPSHVYYLDAKGWVTMGPATRIERSKLEDEGWKPIPGIPAFDVAHFWTANHPFETLFQFQGAKYMPVQQIVEMGYHFNPPLVVACGQPQTEKHNHDGKCYEGARSVVFPQLRGLELEGPFICEYCARDNLATKKAFDQHMEVAHKDERGDLRTGNALASHLAQALLPTLTAGSLPKVTILEADTEQAALEIRTRAEAIESLLTVLQRAGGLTPEQQAALINSGMVEVEDSAEGKTVDPND